MVRATVFASLTAAVSTYAICVLAALASWAFAAHGEATVDDALRAGSFAFLAIHGAPVVIDEARFSLPLLGLLALPTLILTRTLMRAWRRQPIRGRNEMLTLAAIGAAPYLLFALGVILFWSSKDASVPLFAGLLWVLVVCALAVSLTWFFGIRRSMVADVKAPEISLRTRRLIGGSLIWLLFMLVAASLLIAITMAVNASEVWSVAESLDSGPVGLMVLILLAVGWLPAALSWANSYLLGPGFSVGGSTLISPFATNYAELPALPWLAALPDSTNRWHLLFLLVPIVAGMATAGVLRLSSHDHQIARWWRESLTSILVAALVVWVIAWLTRGSLGPGRLSEFGSQPTSLFFAVVILGGVGASALPLFRALFKR